jgi:dimethylglycine dehydrogenase
VTHAYAKSAQIGGAEIVRHTRVTDLKARVDGSWDVITDQGNVHAEHVINAAGLWAREVGRMVGIELPVLAMEHQYLITGDMPELVGKKEQLHAIDFEGEIYIRQERGGMLMGTYERAGVPWSPVTTPWDFGQDLLPNDLERIAPSLEVGFATFPGAGRRRHQKGGQRAVHLRPGRQSLGWADQGIEEFLGRVRRDGRLQPGRRRGLGAVALDGGRRSRRRHLGHGRRALRRLDHARLHQCQGARELFAPLQHSLSERRAAAARPLRTTPIYEKLKAEHAVFGDYCGLEHALWFAPSAAEAEDEISFRRSNAHPHVAAECKAVRDAAGILEISNYGKFEVRGPGAAEWLSRIMANRVPAVGRIALTPMLNERGKLIGDFTMCRVAAGSCFPGRHVCGRNLLLRWFERHLPPAGVSGAACAMEYTGLSVAGPNRARCCRVWCAMICRPRPFRSCPSGAWKSAWSPAYVGRVSFTGDLGFEIWVTPTISGRCTNSWSRPAATMDSSSSAAAR